MGTEKTQGLRTEHGGLQHLEVMKEKSQQGEPGEPVRKECPRSQVKTVTGGGGTNCARFC